MSGPSYQTLTSQEHEQAVLGSVMLSPKAILSPLLIDESLRPDHFWSPRHREVFSAIVKLHDDGDPVDLQTVAAELKRTEARRESGPVDVAWLDGLAAVPAVIGNVRSYARRVKELAVLRLKHDAAHAILQAVVAEDWEALADAEGSLEVEAQRRALWRPDQLGHEVVEFLESDGGERWALPWPRLTRALAGGLRRGTVTVVGGHSSHGKSAMSDQILETIVERYGVAGCIYINEMTRHERTMRYVSRRTGLDLGRLLQPDRADLDAEDWKRIVRAAQQFPWSLVEAEGWSAEDVARHLRQTRPDIALVDIFQLLATSGETRDWDRASRVLNAAAKQAGCALLITTHLNEARSLTVRPKPVLGDIRNTGQLKNDADNVLFVWREQTDDGAEVLDEGVIFAAKARMGAQGIAQPVTFDGRHIRFLTTDGEKRRESDSKPTKNPPKNKDIPF